MFNFKNEVVSTPDWLVIKDCNVVDTFDSEGEINGNLMDILNINDKIMAERKEECFSQFYMASVFKNKFKGLHIHPYKTDTINCIHGKICVVFYPNVVEKKEIGFKEIRQRDFLFIELGEGSSKTISFPSKYPHGFFGIDELSLIINYRIPAWTTEDNYQYDMVNNELVDLLKRKYN